LVNALLVVQLACGGGTDQFSELGSASCGLGVVATTAQSHSPVSPHPLCVAPKLTEIPRWWRNVVKFLGLRGLRFEDMILEKGSELQEFRNGLLRSVRLEKLTADTAQKSPPKLVQELVEFLNTADTAVTLTEPQTAVGYGVIIQKDGMKDAAECVTLQLLEKSTTQVRMMVEEAEEGVLKLWTALSENLVATGATVYVAWVFEFAWKKGGADLELAAQLAEFHKTVREAVVKGNRDAPLLAKRHLILGIQRTGMDQLAQFVRYSDITDCYDLRDWIDNI